MSLLHATPAEHVYPAGTLQLTMSMEVLKALVSTYSCVAWLGEIQTPCMHSETLVML
jgi:hypothetical protein